jgi:hypothetical protein
LLVSRFPARPLQTQALHQAHSRLPAGVHQATPCCPGRAWARPRRMEPRRASAWAQALSPPPPVSRMALDGNAALNRVTALPLVEGRSGTRPRSRHPIQCHLPDPMDANPRAGVQTEAVLAAQQSAAPTDWPVEPVSL